MIVSDAVFTPIEDTPRPTPMHRMTVLLTNSPSTVSARCDHVAVVPPTNTFENTDSTGAAISIAMTTATAVSHDMRNPKRPSHPLTLILLPISRIAMG